MTEQWAVIVAGCAECGTTPLIESMGVHPDEATARQVAGPAEGYGGWKPHPGGGFIYQNSDGAVWIVPLSALAQVTP